MLRDELKEKIESVLGQEVKLEHPAEPAHGDFSIFQKQTDVGADRVSARLKEELGDLVDRVEVAPPGFINFWLSEETFGKELSLALEEGERYGSSKIGSGKTLVIDYSSPNIAKRFGIGHLRSTIIGQAIYNLYGFLGWETVGDNHLGDWGTQFGTLLYQVKSKKWIHSPNGDVKGLTVDEMEELYVDFNEQAKDNPKLWDEARAWFQKLEKGDPEARRIWKKLKEISLEEFDRIYKLLGVSLDVSYGESFYEQMMPPIIEEARKKGIAKKDKGAIVIKYPKGLPAAIIQKSDGATTYLTRDLATIKFRLKEWNPELIVYEVGAEQALHFRQLFAAVELLGWARPASSGQAKKTRFVHVKHGLYLSPGGKKFSTRRGETVKLEDVLAESIKRAEKIVKERPSGEDGLSGRQKAQVAKAVGIGAVKYFDLSHNPESDIVFDWDNIFLLEGNSAPYLQYTYARTRSVLRKANSGHRSSRAKRGDLIEIASAAPRNDGWELNDEEMAILRTFYRYPEIVQEAAESFAPNIVCGFLFDLAQKYNTFYNKHRILVNQVDQVNQVNQAGSINSINQLTQSTQAFRLALNTVVGGILRSGLGLLGIESPEKM